MKASLKWIKENYLLILAFLLFFLLMFMLTEAGVTVYLNIVEKIQNLLS